MYASFLANRILKSGSSLYHFFELQMRLNCVKRQIISNVMAVFIPALSLFRFLCFDWHNVSSFSPKAYLLGSCQVLDAGYVATSCRRALICYRGLLFATLTSDQLSAPVNVSSLTNAWDNQIDAVAEALSFFGPVRPAFGFRVFLAPVEKRGAQILLR